MKGVFAFLFAALLLAPVSGQAEEVSSEDLAQWLCRAVFLDKPEEALSSFPGAEEAQVESAETWHGTDLLNRSKVATWKLETGALTISYSYQQWGVEKEPHGYVITIQAKHEGMTPAVIMFATEAEAVNWLSRVGQVFRDSTGTLVAVAGAGQGSFGWRASVNVAKQDVSVEWFSRGDREAAHGFCSY